MPRRKGFVSEINVTPFVDVMMVLLIIFMVTAPMMDSGLDVDLPQARQVENLPTDSEHLVLTIREDGAMYLDTYQVQLEELEERLTALVKDQNRALFLQADKNVPYGAVVDVMGRIKAAGIEKLGVVAMPATENAASAASGRSKPQPRR
ncbi:protein TolR [uncultured Mailhella sp.]|uniref:protein TolR n=1 Tax=uncultured Mailhella sp. TaxID=1981031 RepID=UPI00261AD824|nr:protein TolR [uncultured Mailhella sp.]